jgi:hypothetical protein
MATEIIPIADAGILGAFYFVVELDGTDYQCSFQFNSREGFWYMDLFDTAGNRIRSGLKVVINWPTIRLDRSEDRPPGEIMFLDTREDPADPGLDELGEDVPMAYVPVADIEALS